MPYTGEQKGINSRTDRSILLGLIGVLTLLGVASGRGGTLGTGIAVVEALTLDQSFTSPFNLGADINDCCRFVAQTFTAGLTGTLGGVNIDVSSPTNSIFPLHVAIRTVVDGVPSTTVLGETTLSSSSAPLSLLITFPQVIPIIAGVQYAIVVNYEGAPPPSPDNFQGIWGGAGGNQYPGGALYLSFLDGISWFGGEADVHFQTYVNLAGNRCPLDQGFWKNHPDAWSVTSLTLGSQTYTQAQLLTILTTPVRGDASLILADQLIAAKLNIANGSDPASVSATITDADSLLSQFGTNRLPYSVQTSSAIGQQMVNDANVLDRYNNGDLTPDCQP